MQRGYAPCQEALLHECVIQGTSCSTPCCDKSLSVQLGSSELVWRFKWTVQVMAIYFVWSSN